MAALLRYGAAGGVDFLVLVVAYGLGFPYQDMVNPRPSRRLRARSVPVVEYQQRVGQGRRLLGEDIEPGAGDAALRHHRR